MSTENPNQQVAETQSDNFPDNEPYFGPPPGGNSEGQGELQQPQTQINELPASPQHVPVAVSGTTNHNQGGSQPGREEEDGARRLDRRRLQMLAIGIVLFNRC